MYYKHQAQSRVWSSMAVATSLFSPVSTGPLFPSPVACLALPISAIAWWTPTQGPQANRWHVETCKMATNSVKLRTLQSLPSNNFPFFQANNYSLISLICEGCGLWDQLMIAESQNQWWTMQWTERIDIHTYETWSSGLREASHWSKNCLRSNLIASEFF